MARILKGKEVVGNIKKDIKSQVEKLKLENKIPTLAIFRVGENGDDVAYEKSIIKCASLSEVEVKNFIFPEDISEEAFLNSIKNAGEDNSINGILVFRPLPQNIDDEKVKAVIVAEKDIDGITDSSMTGVFTGSDLGFPPCTAEACMVMLDFYNINVEGKNAVILGRSLVIGKPVAMMLMEKNATVTICHSKTKEIEKIIEKADILVASIGSPRMVKSSVLRDGQIVLDVGINVDEEGKLCGDVDFDKAIEKDLEITPVPGGVGTVTTWILIKHLVEATSK